MTEEMAYAPITYNDGSSIDFQDKTLLDLTLAGEPAVLETLAPAGTFVSASLLLYKRSSGNWHSLNKNASHPPVAAMHSV